MTQPTPNNNVNIYERVISGTNLIITILTLAIGGMVWNAVKLNNHDYRIDKLELSRSDDRKEVLAAISNMAADLKSLSATVADMKMDMKTDAVLQHQADATRDAQIKVILDRIEKK